MELRGIFPALTTPFAGDRFAAGRLRDNIERYERVGPAGYLALGSTGEAVLLEEDERAQVLETARAAIPVGKPLIAGVTAESTVAAARQARAAAGLGCDAVLVGAPHYFRDQLTHHALIAHYRAIADRSPVPVLLYNVPKFTGLALAPEVVLEAGRHENVIGMKDSSGDLGYLRAIVARAGRGFHLLCGASALVSEALAAGAAGAILAAADVVPEVFIEIGRRASRGDAGAAAELERAIADSARAVAGALGIAGIKAAMDLRGLFGGAPRSPLLPLPESDRRLLSQRIDTLVQSGVLPSPTLPG